MLVATTNGTGVEAAAGVAVDLMVDIGIELAPGSVRGAQQSSPGVLIAVAVSQQILESRKQSPCDSKNNKIKNGTICPCDSKKTITSPCDSKKKNRKHISHESGRMFLNGLML